MKGGFDPPKKDEQQESVIKKKRHTLFLPQPKRASITLEFDSFNA